MQTEVEIMIADFSGVETSLLMITVQTCTQRGEWIGERERCLKISGFSGVETSLCSQNGKHWHLNWDNMHSAGV